MGEYGIHVGLFTPARFLCEFGPGNFDENSIRTRFYWRLEVVAPRYVRLVLYTDFNVEVGLRGILEAETAPFGNIDAVTVAIVLKVPDAEGESGIGTFKAFHQIYGNRESAVSLEHRHVRVGIYVQFTIRRKPDIGTPKIAIVGKLVPPAGRLLGRTRYYTPFGVGGGVPQECRIDLARFIVTGRDNRVGLALSERTDLPQEEIALGLVAGLLLKFQLDGSGLGKSIFFTEQAIEVFPWNVHHCQGITFADSLLNISVIC